MATIERLREVGRIATEHFNWSQAQQRPNATPEAHFRFYRPGLTLWVHPLKVPLGSEHQKVRHLKPFGRWNEPPATHGADFMLYQRLLKFFELDLGHWVGWSRSPIDIHYQGQATRHDAAHTASRLRWTLKLETNGGIEIRAYQDSHMGPGRTNGSRHSIETHNYRSLGNHERLWWRYVTWRLRAWFAAQGFKDRTEPHFEDPEEEIEARVRASWHWKGEDTIYAPRKTESYNDRDANGKRLINGEVKAFRDYHTKGIVIGRVFHNINNMWWAIAGARVCNKGSSELFDWDPRFAGRENRRWMKPEDRLEHLRRVKAKLVKEEKYERAAKVRDQEVALSKVLEKAKAERMKKPAPAPSQESAR